MKFVTLKSFDKKKLLISTLIITSIILVITIFVSHAEFTSTDHVTIVDGVINYTPYDFKVMAMYIDSDTGYIETNTMPGAGYEINQEESYCYKTNPNEKIKDKVYTNNDGEHIIKDLEKNTKCILYFDSLSKKTYNTLVKLNTELKSEGVIDENGFTGTSEELNQNGLYETEDDDGISYYFRGNVENNYVKFGTDFNGADIYWRIIRINGNGSIRMIYAGTSTNGNAPAQTGLGTAINNGEYYTFNNSWDKAEYVGYQYTLGQRNGNEKDSNAKTVLENWFKENLIEEYEAGYIDKNAGFCGDRTTYDYVTKEKNDNLGTGVDNVHFGAEIRIADTYVMPTLKCNNEDLFTPTTSNKGTQSLTYPIGLSTVDEQAYAGAFLINSNEKYYLYNNELYWTMSPASFSGFAFVFYVYYDGSLNGAYLGIGRGLRPVINLAMDALKNGKGTALDPFQL